MSRRPPRHRKGHRRTRALAALAWALVIATGGLLLAQSLTVDTRDGALRVRASRLGVIAGDVLSHLEDGRTVRLALELSVLAKPGAAPAAQIRGTFVLSYDLWEQRFAATLAEAPSQTASHLTPAAAESWCVDQLKVPLEPLRALGPDASFWLRLEYRVLDPERLATSEDGGYTLRSLIEALSRRPGRDLPARAIDAGPFRLPQ